MAGGCAPPAHSALHPGCWNTLNCRSKLELADACVVVSRDLHVLHANKAARKYFGKAERRSGEMEFTDLPQALGAKVYQVLRTGSAISSFNYQPEDAPGTVYRINVVPFQRQQAGL